MTYAYMLCSLLDNVFYDRGFERTGDVEAVGEILVSLLLERRRMLLQETTCLLCHRHVFLVTPDDEIMPGWISSANAGWCQQIAKFQSGVTSLPGRMERDMT